MTEKNKKMTKKPAVKTKKTVKPAVKKQPKQKKIEIDIKRYEYDALVYIQSGQMSDYLKSLPNDDTVKKDQKLFKDGKIQYYIKNKVHPYVG